MSAAPPPPQKAAVVKVTTLRGRLESDEFRMAVAKALPRHLTPERFIRVAATAIMRTPKLAMCDQTSFFTALLNLSLLGLEPDGRRAHLIPFENRKRKCVECQLIIDYKGLAELVMRSGNVTKLHADVVCENDEFEFDRGEVLKHRIDLRKPRGKAYAVYAMVLYQGQQRADIMSIEDVERVRRRSRAANDGPWVTDWDEMAKKTVFRRMSKWLPLSPEVRDAADMDDDNVIDVKAGNSMGFDLGELPASAESDEGQQAAGTSSASSAADQAAEAAAGLAPQQKPTGASAPTTPAAGGATVQDQLASVVLGGGFTFEEWRAWAAADGHIKDKELPSFDLVPDAVANRLIMAKAGMLHVLAKRKAAQ